MCTWELAIDHEIWENKKKDLEGEVNLQIK